MACSVLISSELNAVERGVGQRDLGIRVRNCHQAIATGGKATSHVKTAKVSKPVKHANVRKPSGQVECANRPHCEEQQGHRQLTRSSARNLTWALEHAASKLFEPAQTRGSLL
jgi:hypothetical protein